VGGEGGERSLEADCSPLDAVVLNVGRVTVVEPGAPALLDGLRASLEKTGVRFAIAVPLPEISQGGWFRAPDLKERIDCTPCCYLC